MDQKACCGCASTAKPDTGGCCPGSAGRGMDCCAPVDKKLLIEFMYIDLTVCDRCLGTDASLEEAVNETANVLKATGYNIEVRKILVESEEQARDLGFVSSPTIRINGQDIQLDLKESLCESCGDVCGEDVDCRVWIWQGREYTTPPKAMIIDAILKHVYGGAVGGANLKPREVPDNLKRFFAAKLKSVGRAE